SWVMMSIGLMLLLTGLPLFGQDDFTTTFDYDDAGRLVRIIYQPQNSDVVNELTFTYDAGSHLVRVQGIDQSGEFIDTIYTYDALDRLVNWEANTQPRHSYYYHRRGIMAIEDL